MSDVGLIVLGFVLGLAPTVGPPVAQRWQETKSRLGKRVDKLEREKVDLNRMVDGHRRLSEADAVLIDRLRLLNSEMLQDLGAVGNQTGEEAVNRFRSRWQHQHGDWPQS